MPMKLLTDTDVKGKFVVARIDCDEPISIAGELVSDFRVRAALPTIEYLRSHGAKQIVLVAHLGRPVVRQREQLGLIMQGNARLSAKPVAARLRELVGKPIESINTRRVEGFSLPAFIIDRGLYLIENIRFDWRETANDDSLGKELASLGDLYVFDAFADAHRAHASTTAVAKHTEVVAGLQLQREVEHLGQLVRESGRPFVAVMGGAKMETKVPVIQYLLDKVDLFLLGGVLANTFARASGEEDVKRSVVDEAQVELASQLLKDHRQQFVLPIDYVWQTDKIMDIGPKTRARMAEEIGRAQTVFWNGTLGVTSTTAQEFKYGSLEVARAIGKNRSATTIVSGGDTVGLLEEQAIDLGQFTFVSTGGGATLEFLAGQELPALRELGYYTAA